MQPDDFVNFSRVLDAAYSLHSKALSADARALFFAALGKFSLADVRKAFSAHISDPQRGQYPPKPADLIAHLVGDATKDGRPDANEAWAIALRSRDERDTVVWTQECAQAFAIASAVLDEGDEVGARMAFKAAYERLIEAARAQGLKAQWVASLGHDPHLREQVLTDAVHTGRLLLADVKAVVPALAAPVEAYDTEKARRNLAAIKAMIGAAASARDVVAQQRAREIQAEAERLEFRKLETAVRVADYERSHA